MQLEKLAITRIKHKNRDGTYAVSTSPSDIFTCQFNPTEFQIGKTNNWQADSSIGTDSEQLTFTGGSAQDISLSFMFDSTDTGEKVTDLYENLKNFTFVDSETRETETTGKGEPPWVHVQWGQLIAFPAVITQFTEKYQLFTPSGAPIRAEVSLTLKQAQDPTKKSGQNPTSRSEGRKAWIVQDGERLDWIAYEEYGDANAWRHIAAENNIVDPLALYPGQILQLTPVKHAL